MYGIGLLLEDMGDGKMAMKILVGCGLRGCYESLWLEKWASGVDGRQQNEVEHEATRWRFVLSKPDLILRDQKIRSDHVAIRMRFIATM